MFLTPLICYGESETVAEGKKNTTYHKAKIHTAGNEETTEFVKQQTSELALNERVTEKCQIQANLTQMTYTIYLSLHGPVTVKAFKRNTDGSRGSELRILEMGYQITPPPKYPEKNFQIIGCSGDTELEFTGTSEAVGDKAHYWWEVQIIKSGNAGNTNKQKIGSPDEPIPIAPGQVHKAIITSEGGEVRPFFTGGSKK